MPPTAKLMRFDISVIALAESDVFIYPARPNCCQKCESKLPGTLLRPPHYTHKKVVFISIFEIAPPSFLRSDFRRHLSRFPIVLIARSFANGGVKICIKINEL